MIIKYKKPIHNKGTMHCKKSLSEKKMESPYKENKKGRD